MFKLADTAFCRAGECTGFVAEHLRLEHRLRQRAAIHRDKRLVTSRRQFMQTARDQLLARAGVAIDQHGCIGRRDIRDQLARSLGAGGFDVILLDLSLPDSDGIGTLTAIRVHAPQVPVLVLTGSNNETLANSALQHGAQDYIVKGQFDGNSLARLHLPYQPTGIGFEVRPGNDDILRRAHDRSYIALSDRRRTPTAAGSSSRSTA